MREGHVLLPPAERGRLPLPGWLAAVALLGLALLVCSTVPAVLRRSRLARDLDRLLGQVEVQEREVLRLECELGAARNDTFAFEQALQRLVHPPPLPGTADGAPPSGGAGEGAAVEEGPPTGVR